MAIPAQNPQVYPYPCRTLAASCCEVVVSAFRVGEDVVGNQNLSRGEKRVG